MEKLVLSNALVLKALAREDVSFSGMSQNRLVRLIQARRLQEGQAALPDSIAAHEIVAFKAHKWSHKSEVKESKSLLEHLQREVCAASGLAAIDNVFMDVQSLNSSNPMSMTVEDHVGELTVTGVPDAIVLVSGLDEGVFSPFANACAVFDWKISDKVGKSDVQIMTQAVVLAGDGVNGAPAFVTDLVTGFRCWIVIDGILFRFHPADKPGQPKVLGWLNLADGAALVRYFIRNHGRMSAADEAALLRSRRDGGGVGIGSAGDGGASGGGSSSGDGGGSRGGPSGRGGHSAPADDSDACPSTAPSGSSEAGAGRFPPPSHGSGGAVTRGSRVGRRGAASAAGGYDGCSSAAENDEDCRESASGFLVEQHPFGGPQELKSPLDMERPSTGEGTRADSPIVGSSIATRSLSKVEVAAYQAVALEEFAMQVRIVGEAMELHPSHYPN